jgi:asparagine synthase (glutamine-hydrolysing)
MTAFAAIVSLDDRPVHDAVARRDQAVADVLSASTRRPAQALQLGPCTLVMAPLHAWDPERPIVNAGIAAVGDVLFEDHAAVMDRCGLPRSAPALDGVVALVAGAANKLSQWRGEIAFTAWNTIERRLTCVRDPLGIRPVFIGTGPRTIVLSNLLEAVIAHPDIPRTLDQEALVRFLATGSITTTVATPYQHVSLMPEGHRLDLGADGRVTLERYWSPAPPRGRTDRTAGSIMEDYRAVLRDAVSDRIEGKPCTIFLSGGIDSTTLAAVARETSSPLRAATLRFTHATVADEDALAAAVAARLGIPLDVIDADRYGALCGVAAGEAATLVDEPTLGNWRHTIAHAARYSSLAIYGEDGDTLLQTPLWRDLRAVQSWRSLLWESARFVITERRPPHLGLRLRQRARLRPQAAEEVSWLNPPAARIAAAPETRTILGHSPRPLGRTSEVWAKLLKNVPRDFALSISPNVTKQPLTLTMPLMDTRVIEFVESVPPVPWRQNKQLARRAFAHLLPQSVIDRPKTPVRGYYEALVSAWRNLEGPTRVPKAVSECGWVDEAAWQAAVLRGGAFVATAAWRVLILNAWLESNRR